jgi:hypothetical protein
MRTVRTTGIPDFVCHPEFEILGNIVSETVLFPTSDEGMEIPTLLGPL